MNEGTGSSPQDKEMQIWGLPNRLPRNGPISWTNKDGPNQIKWNQTLAYSKNCERCQIFHGFHKFLQKIHWKLLEHSKTLINLTKKYELWNWSNTCQNAFNQIKNIFIKEPVLQLPNLTKPFEIAMDASKYASGGVLLQKDTNGEWHPCSYLSQLFRPAE